MQHLWATLTVAISTLTGRLRAHHQTRLQDDPERGDVVGWIIIVVFVLAIAAIAFVAVRGLVEGEIAKIVSPNG